MHRVRSLVALIIVLTLAGCGVPLGAASCSEQSADFLNQVQPIAREWDDATKLANGTPRASLAAQIANLQAVRRKVQDLKPPECAKKAQDALTASMDATIQGFLDFLAQKPDATVKADFNTAQTQMIAFGAAMGEIRGGGTATP